MKLEDFPPHVQQRIKRQMEADLQARSAGPVAVMESDSCHAPLEAEKVQRPAGSRFLVRIESIRKRLLDDDNLCEKYHVDQLRYVGVIPDDNPGLVEIEVSQRKAAKGEQEKILIEVLTK